MLAQSPSPLRQQPPEFVDVGAAGEHVLIVLHRRFSSRKDRWVAQRKQGMTKRPGSLLGVRRPRGSNVLRQDITLAFRAARDDPKPVIARGVGCAIEDIHYFGRAQLRDYRSLKRGFLPKRGLI